MPCGSSERGAQEEDQQGFHLNLLLQKWKPSQKRQQERINLQIKKCKRKGKGEQKEYRPKWLTMKREETPLQKSEKLKMKRVPSDAAGEKAAQSD